MLVTSSCRLLASTRMLRDTNCSVYVLASRGIVYISYETNTTRPCFQVNLCSFWWSSTVLSWNGVAKQDRDPNALYYARSHNTNEYRPVLVQVTRDGPQEPYVFCFLKESDDQYRYSAL